VTSGERLIKFVYESIRASSCWTKSALIITYDEHGGFYDHFVPPGGVAAPGDVAPKYGFDFTQLGVRVPAIVVSPWIPKNLIDHTTYDHTTVLATLREWFQLQYLTDIGFFDSSRFIMGRDPAFRRRKGCECGSSESCGIPGRRL